MPAKPPAPRSRKRRVPRLKEAPGLSKEGHRARSGLSIFLRQATEFRLALALYNDPLVRDSLIRELALELAPQGLRLLTLDLREPGEGRTLLARVEALARTAPSGERVAIMVVNLEGCIDYTPELSRPGGPGTAFIETANLHRDLFPASCPGPLVLWMTELLERAFVKYAPDLWHWRSHVFDLRTRRSAREMAQGPEIRALPSHDYRLHPEERLRRLEEELVAYRKTGNRFDEMRVLTEMGRARLDAGDARLARHDFGEALRLAREIGSRRGEGNALGNLGNVHAVLGDARKAIEFYEQHRDITREIGDQRGEGAALGNLGLAYFALGDAPKAIEFHEQALAIHRVIGDRQAEGADLGNLGIVYPDLGDARKAIEFHEQALVIYREIGDRRGEGTDLGNLGNVYLELGDARKAIEFHEQAFLIAREVGDRRMEGNALGNLGRAYAALGETRSAIEFYEQALVIDREIGDRLGEGNDLFNSALTFHHIGEREEALARCEGALRLYESIEYPGTPEVRGLLAKWRGEAGGEG